jgi:hypothetical protein
MAEITLDRAPDDPPEYDPKYQDELAAFARSLDAAGISYNQISIALHTADAGGWPLGQFLLSFGQEAIPPLAALAGAWVQARYGRRVRLKIGDVEVEARTIEEIERLEAVVRSFRNHDLKNSDES